MFKDIQMLEWKPTNTLEEFILWVKFSNLRFFNGYLTDYVSKF